MNTIKFLSWFIVLINLEVIHAFHKFVPSDKELIYSWTADVKAGTSLPVYHASQFVLQGNIHLQTKNDSVLVKITNLTHRLYNGIFDHVQEHEAKDLPVPREVADLGNVFRVVYNERGLVEAIATRKKEKEFSRNIKKAIATILQLDISIVHQKNQKPEALINQEKSIYGHGEDVYSVFPHEDKIEVHKFHKMADPVDFASYSVTNMEPAYCDVKPEKVVMHDNQKKYFLSKEKESFSVKHIASIGSIVYYPFRAQSESHIILVNQSFQLSDVVPIKQRYRIDSEHLEDSLTYHSFEEDHEGLTVDETNGRRVVDYRRLFRLVKAMLKDIPQYLREDHFNTKEPDFKRGQLINRVHKVLQRFSLQKLQELQKTLPEESLNVFYQVLPLVGTEASTLLTKIVISGKRVNDETAVRMLQRVPEIIKPSLSLLHKLEDLIHLDNSFSWEVRKVAILSFGSLVHRSYLKQLSSKHVNSNRDLQKPYGQYVDEYIHKMKKSDSYTVQLCYLLGLRNMKLPILADRLIPAFTGEWFQDRNLRFNAIWAAAPPTIFNSNPDKIIDTFWPVFTNREELTEIRALSYYYIMYSRPSYSTLRNIFTFMLTEPDKELYRFHYSLSQSLMQSKEPCHQDIRLKVAQAMKFSPPPAKRFSSVNFFGYHSDQYGFSAGVQSYQIKTNDSYLYGIFYTTQQFNIQEEKYFLFLRVYEKVDYEYDLLSTLYSIVNGKSDCYIEASITKHDQVINTFIIDKNNVHELLPLVKVALKESSSSLNKDLLYINYEKYHSSLIPTDLGIPAMWEYLAPEVYHNNLSIVKEILKLQRKISFSLRNKLSSWMHFRHGLSFYNPISDVWHGINRFHSFNTLLPFALNITASNSVEFKWKKDEDPQMNMIGTRSHVSQMVFVTNDQVHDRNVLTDFVPKGKEFEEVDYEKDGKEDYLTVDQVCPVTGHHLFLEVDDSNAHNSNSFHNILSAFTNTASLYYNSPWEYASAAAENLLRNIYLNPEPGRHSFILKLEPSDTNPVTQIDMIIYSGQNNRSDKSFEQKGHLTYEAKNQDTIVRKYDLEGTFGGSFVGDFFRWSFQLTRIIPGQKNCKLYIDAFKQWERNEVEGQLKIRMGGNEDEHCTNDTVIEVIMKGQKSVEQLEGKFEGTNVIDCLLSNSTVRHYVYEVSSKNMCERMKKNLKFYWNSLRSFYPHHYSYKWQSGDTISDNSFKMDVLYPLEEQQANINIHTSDGTYEISRIPTEGWRQFGLVPDSTIYSNRFLKTYEADEMDYCFIRGNPNASENIPESWKNVHTKNPLLELSFKDVEDKMLLKVLYDASILEVTPDGLGYRVTLDDVVLKSEEELHGWMYYRVFTEDNRQVIAVFVRRPEILLKFDGKDLEVLLQRYTFGLKGLCLK